MVSLTLNSDRLIVQLNALSRALNEDMRLVVRDEVKKLANTIVNITPPFNSKGGMTGNAAVSHRFVISSAGKDAGEGAISRELDNLISEARHDFITMVSKKWGLSEAHGFVTGKDKNLLQIDFQHIDPDGSRLGDLHQGFRNRRGKVPLRKPITGSWNSRILTTNGIRYIYTRTVQERVGTWKATWAYTSHRCGETKIPGWISRHFGTIAGLSIFDDSGMANERAPWITFGSRFPGNYRFKQSFKDAVKIRAKAIANRLKLIRSGYSKEVAQGIRPSPKAKQTEGT